LILCLVGGCFGNAGQASDKAIVDSEKKKDRRYDICKQFENFAGPGKNLFSAVLCPRMWNSKTKDCKNQQSYDKSEDIAFGGQQSEQRKQNGDIYNEQKQ
jgi:hypothetical protein